MTPTVTLLHIHGSHKGSTQSFDLTEGKSVVFGRLPSSDIAFDPLQDIKASGRHARLFRQDGRCLVEDLRSSNGTFINGQRLDMASVPIRSGDVIEFGGGGPRVRVTFDDPSALTTSDPSVDAHSQTLPLNPSPSPAPGPAPSPAASSSLDPSALTAEAPSLPNKVAVTRPPTLRPSPLPDPAAATQPEAPPLLGPLSLPATPTPLIPPLYDPPALPAYDGSKRFTSMLVVISSVLLLVIIVLTVFIARSKQAQARIDAAEEALTAAQASLRDLRADATALQASLAAAQASLRDLSSQRDAASADLRSLLQRLDAESALLRQRADALADAVALSTRTMRVEVSADTQARFPHPQEAATQLEPAAQALIRANAASVFWLGAPPPDAPSDAPRCVAFVVHPDGWLASSATCLHDLLTHRTPDHPPTAYNTTLTLPLDLDSASLHPHYSHVASPDLGLIRAALPAGQRLPAFPLLASPADLAALAPGQPLYALTPPSRGGDLPPLLGGGVVSLSPFPTAPPGAPTQWLWHTALTRPLTSGAPLLDRAGRVVAIQSGLRPLDEVTTSDGQRHSVQRLLSADAIAFAVRVDLLQELLMRHNIPSTPIPGAPP